MDKQYTSASAVADALKQAFSLGQSYWQQADSEFVSQNKKSDETFAKFQSLLAKVTKDLAERLEQDERAVPAAFKVSGLDGGKLYAHQLYFTADEAKRTASEFAKHYTITKTEPLYTHPAPTRGEDERDAALKRVAELEALLDTPTTDDWFDGVRLEAGHQIKRWGVEHDAGKTAADWFWLVGYLAGKALTAANSGNDEKARHHTISTAAVLLNWHRAIVGESNAMRPGIAPPDAAMAQEGGAV